MTYIKFSNSVPCSSTPSEKLAALKLPKVEWKFECTGTLKGEAKGNSTLFQGYIEASWKSETPKFILRSQILRDDQQNRVPYRKNDSL